MKMKTSQSLASQALKNSEDSDTQMWQIVPADPESFAPLEVEPRRPRSDRSRCARMKRLFYRRCCWCCFDRRRLLLFIGIALIGLSFGMTMWKIYEEYIMKCPLVPFTPFATFSTKGGIRGANKQKAKWQGGWLLMPLRVHILHSTLSEDLNSESTPAQILLHTS